MGLKKRLSGVPAVDERHQTGIRRTDRTPVGNAGGVRHRVRVLERRQDAHPVEGGRAARLGKPAARLAGNGRMIQITAQMRVLVAIEPVDGRKGLTRWRGSARTSSPEIHSPDACLCFGAVVGRRFVSSVMTAKVIGWHMKVIEDVCQKYACACTVKTATKPSQPIEKHGGREPADPGDRGQVCALTRKAGGDWLASLVHRPDSPLY
jgi:hypothetical protein